MTDIASSGNRRAAASSPAALRRRLACGLALLLTIRPAVATPETMRSAIRKVVGEATLHKGRVKLDMPAAG